MFPDIDIKNIAIDSRQVVPGSLFCALVGTKIDGHDHLLDAIQKGATALLVSKPDRVPKTFAGKVIVSTNVREDLAKLCSIFFQQPDQKLKLIGVTGTNGKTTTVYMLEHILNYANMPTGVLGTIDHHFKNHVWKSELTTPDIVSLYKRLKEMLDLGAKAVAMEISSHALDQKRVRGVALDVGIWTNFTRDHLDYHGTTAAYFSAKKKLFDENLGIKKGFAFLNNDDPQVGKVQVPGAKTFTFGQSGGDFKFDIVEKTLGHSKFNLQSPFGQGEFYLPTPGTHNVYNAVGSIGAALALGVSMVQAQEALNTFYGAPGRLEKIPNVRSRNVFVDYAHTPDAVSSSLSSLKELLKNSCGKLWIVFGFGGDRDKGKRPLMVQEALKLADHLVLTSDNPRFENPNDIINDGLSVVPHERLGRSVYVEVDRRKAISFALQSSNEDDVILIAGKGHEDYQIVGDKILHFSDREAVMEILK